METSRIAVFPGLDGTSLLLKRFVELAPQACSVVVMPLPDDPTDDYDSLCDKMASKLHQVGPCHVIAESFSGPLGILLAHRHPELVKRLSLIASFADSPVSFLARWLPWNLIFRMPIPLFVAQRLLVGSDQEMAIQLKHAVQQTSPATMAKRLRCLTEVDVRSELAEIDCPVDYLRPSHDRLVSENKLKRIINANPAVLIRKLDGPHLILQTHPEQAWSAIFDSH